MLPGAELPAISAAADAHARALQGDLSAARQVIARLTSSTDPSGRAWAAALSVQIWLAAPTAVSLPSATSLEAFVSESAEPRRAALFAAVDLAVVYLLRFDGRTFAELAATADALAHALGDEARAPSLLVQACAALAAGDDVSALAASTEAAARAASARLPSVLVQATALRSFASGDDVEQALSIARRASLMGRSEGIAHAEFLAHLALVRARRRAGQPHLGLRIASALAEVVTAPWRPLLAWERLWAGGAPDAAFQHDFSPAADAVVAFSETLSGAHGGDRARLAAALERTRVACSGFAPALRELTDFAACIDVAAVPCSAEAAEFRAGLRTLTPSALHGLKLRAAGTDDTETAGAYVYRKPDGHAVRLLHWGVPLLADEASLARVKQSQRTQGRIETLLAILSLCGPDGVEDAPCFEAAYGFRYVTELHRGVFEVLLHRARAALEGIADIVREPGRLRLSSHRPLLIPDPRVSERTQDRILRYLAQEGAASARDAALRLGVSLRAAQGALKELSSAGACQTRRDGRTVAYVVEDTVFSEPTRRLAAQSLGALADVAKRSG